MRFVGWWIGAHPTLVPGEGFRFVRFGTVYALGIYPPGAAGLLARLSDGRLLACKANARLTRDQADRHPALGPGSQEGDTGGGDPHVFIIGAHFEDALGFWGSERSGTEWDFCRADLAGEANKALGSAVVAVGGRAHGGEGIHQGLARARAVTVVRERHRWVA